MHSRNVLLSKGLPRFVLRSIVRTTEAGEGVLSKRKIVLSGFQVHRDVGVVILPWRKLNAIYLSRGMPRD